MNDVFEADDYVTTAPLLSLKDSARSGSNSSPQLIVPPAISAKRALKLSGFDGDLSSTSTLESLVSQQSTSSIAAKMDKMMGNTASAGPRQIGVSLVRKVKEASRQRAAEREQKRKDADPPLVPFKLQDPPKKKRPAPAIPSLEESSMSTPKDDQPSTSKKPASFDNENLYMNSTTLANLASSTPKITQSSTTTTCYHCHSHQPACALEAANQRRSSTGNLPDLVADSAAGTFQPPVSTVCEDHVVTVPPCPNYVNADACLAHAQQQQQHPQHTPHQACSCSRCRSNYMNQGFIESLKYYYNIDNVVLQLSEKLAHCNCCNCKTAPPPLGQQNRYAPMGPASLYMPMEECQRHVSESTTMSTAPEDPDSDVPSETAPSVPTSGYTTPKSEPDQIFGFDEVEAQPGTSGDATVIEVNESGSDDEQQSRDGNKKMADSVQAAAEIKVECEVLSSSCRGLPLLYERKAFTPPPSMTYGVDYGGLMRSNLQPFRPCAAVAYQQQMSNSSRQSIPPGFFSNNSDYPELALNGSLHRSSPHRHSIGGMIAKECHRRSQSCADSLHDRVQYTAISHQRSVSAISPSAATHLRMGARIGKRCESCPGKSGPAASDNHHQSHSSMKTFSKAKRFLSNLFKRQVSSPPQCSGADDQSSSSWFGSLGRRSRQSVASLESKDAIRVQSAPPNYCNFTRHHAESSHHDQRVLHVSSAANSRVISQAYFY